MAYWRGSEGHDGRDGMISMYKITLRDQEQQRRTRVFRQTRRCDDKDRYTLGSIVRSVEFGLPCIILYSDPVVLSHWILLTLRRRDGHSGVYRRMTTKFCTCGALP